MISALLEFCRLLMNVSEDKQTLAQLTTTPDPEFMCFGDYHVIMTSSFFLKATNPQCTHRIDTIPSTCKRQLENDTAHTSPGETGIRFSGGEEVKSFLPCYRIQDGHI